MAMSDDEGMRDRQMGVDHQDEVYQVNGIFWIHTTNNSMGYCLDMHAQHFIVTKSLKSSDLVVMEYKKKKKKRFWTSLYIALSHLILITKNHKWSFLVIFPPTYSCSSFFFHGRYCWLASFHLSFGAWLDQSCKIWTISTALTLNPVENVVYNFTIKP